MVLEEFEVGNYRGIGKLRVTGLNRINLIAGGNSSGKTSLLESVWLFHNRRKPYTLWRADFGTGHCTDPVAELGRDGEISMRGIQNGGSHSYSVAFVGDTGGRNSDEPYVAGRLDILLDGERATGPTGYTTVRGKSVAFPKLDGVEADSAFLRGSLRGDPNGFPNVIRNGQKQSLVERLRVISPLKDAHITVEGGDQHVLVETESGGLHRLENMGGGMVWLFDCLVALYTSRNGIVCMDEIGSRLHHTLLPGLWGAIQAISVELNVQVFAATHSSECINAAIRACRGADLAVHALYHDGDAGHAKSVRYNGDELDAIDDMKADIA